MKKIWVHTIINNEENFIWFALMSVIDYVDKILIWDTGSTDKTKEIVRGIGGEKIELKEVGELGEDEFTKARQAMLEQSDCDWILILDGDEVWWKDSIKKVVEEINANGDKLDGIAVPMVVPVGDIYHFQSEEAGKYTIKGKTGHISLKAINRRIDGLHADMPYGKEGYYDGSNILIQERENIHFLEAPFLHLTHLKRSSKIRKYDKYKVETGEPFAKDFKYPESLYKGRPEIVPDPWQKMSGRVKLAAKIITPVKQIKRKFF